eukprot:SAG22_NODE_1864_length_3414_cov_1.391855_4_plen_185_part_00
MMVPNRQTIMTVKLASCGYKANQALGKKFHVLYRLCEQQLSKQTHYDFGLRNILSVLRTCGSTKRAELDKPENLLFMRTVRDMNLSKYVAEDVPLFLSLITDTFPGIKAEKAVYPDVEAAVANQIKRLGLQVRRKALLFCCAPTRIVSLRRCFSLHCALSALAVPPGLGGESHPALRDVPGPAR